MADSAIETKMRNYTVALEDALTRRMKALAAMRGIPVCDLYNIAVREYVERNPIE